MEGREAEKNAATWNKKKQIDGSHKCSLHFPPLFLVSDAKIYTTYSFYATITFFFQMRLSFNKKWSATLLTYKVAADVAPAVDNQTL